MIYTVLNQIHKCLNDNNNYTFIFYTQFNNMEIL